MFRKFSSHYIELYKPKVLSWLRVFRSVNAVRLLHGGGQERETTTGQSEKCVGRYDSESDEMRMITASFMRALQGCTGSLSMYFHLIFQ